MGLRLTWHDVVHMYECHKLASAGYSLKSQSEVVKLISCLPKSNKGMKDDYVIFLGEWSDDLHCPTWAGDLGGVLLGPVPLEGNLAFLAFIYLFFFIFYFLSSLGDKFCRSDNDFLLGCFCRQQPCCFENQSY